MHMPAFVRYPALLLEGVLSALGICREAQPLGSGCVMSDESVLRTTASKGKLRQMEASCPPCMGAVVYVLLPLFSSPLTLAVFAVTKPWGFLSSRHL